MTLADIHEMNTATHALHFEALRMQAFDTFEAFRCDNSAREDYDAYSERFEMLAMQYHHIDAVRIERTNDSFHHVVVRTLKDACFACQNLDFDRDETLQAQCFRFDHYADFQRFMMHCISLVTDEAA